MYEGKVLVVDFNVYIFEYLVVNVSLLEFSNNINEKNCILISLLYQWSAVNKNYNN